MKKLHTAFLSTCLTMAALSSAQAYDSDRDWGTTVLNYQNYLDYHVPFGETVWIGTHNGYSSKHWKSLYADGIFNHANQQRTPLATFEAGVRWTEYDLHLKYGNSDNPVMCHFGAYETCLSGDYKDFEDGLEEVTEYLAENPQHSDSIFFIKVELFGAQSQERISEIIEKTYYSYATGDITVTSTNPGSGYGYLPDLIYKPEDAKKIPGYHYDNNDRCTAIDGGVLTKNHILNAGARIIMMTNNRDCNDGIDELFAPYLFVQSVKYDSNGNFSSMETSMDRHGDPEECYSKSRTWHKKNMSYDHDGRTQNDSSASAIEDGHVPPYLGCGLNGLEHFNYESNNTSIGGDRKYSYQNIWSWGNGQPNSASGRCGHLQADGAQQVEDANGNAVNLNINDRTCSNNSEYLCERPDGSFFISSAANDWEYGQQKCHEDEAGAFFSVPANGADLLEISAIYDDAGVDGLWINYFDTTGNNDWRAMNSIATFSVDGVDENQEATTQNVEYCGGNAQHNIVLADVSSINGSDPSVLRMYESSGQCYLLIQEDQSTGTEVAHADENVDVVVLRPHFPFGETGKVTVTNNSTTVSLNESYTNPVVIAFAATKNGNDPVVATVENITASSFDVSVKEFEWDDGTHSSAEDVHYLVIEEGTYDVNGRTFIAGIEDVSTKLDGSPTDHTVNVGLDDFKVVTTVQSSDSNFVLDVEVNRNGDSFSMGFMPEEAKDSSGATITGKIGYIAVQHQKAWGEE